MGNIGGNVNKSLTTRTNITKLKYLENFLNKNYPSLASSHMAFSWQSFKFESKHSLIASTHFRPGKRLKYSEISAKPGRHRHE